MRRAAILAVLLAAAAAWPAAPSAGREERGRTVAVTIDDLPKAGQPGDLASARRVTDDLLAGLTRHAIPAVGFVNEIQLYVPGEVDDRIALLRQWLDAGLELGNHTFSHPRLFDTPLADYQDDVIRGDVVTRRLMKERGRAPRWFRHPYTSTGATPEIRDALVAFLRDRGYAVAPFTIEDSDYAFQVAWMRAVAAGDRGARARVGDAYLDHQDAMFEYFEKLSRRVLGEEPPQILLIHANELNAALIDDVVARIRRRGYRFVTLDEAMAHRAYALADGYAGPAGPSWLHRWAIGLGQKGTARDEPDPPAFILDTFQAR